MRGQGARGGAGGGLRVRAEGHRSPRSLPQFAVLLTCIFLVEIAAAIAGYIFKDKVGTSLPCGSRQTAPACSDPWFSPCLQYSCCGARNYTDWFDYDPFKGNNTVPKSCCQANATMGWGERGVHTGCAESIEAWLKKHIVIVAAVALGIAFFELLGIVFACCLMKGIRRGYEVM
uniref:Uncharacterized protein n=1 Tax=Terrapene triunguis TaxID=2587831 RepID=A0A674J6F7_9SAUR